MIHEQLPLPVPCYDLALLTEPTLIPLAWSFGYSQLAWLDGRISIVKFTSSSHVACEFLALRESKNLL